MPLRGPPADSPSPCPVNTPLLARSFAMLLPPPPLPVSRPQLPWHRAWCLGLSLLLLLPTGVAGCSFGGKRSASGEQGNDDTVCLEYQPRCSELFNSRWLSVENRCMHQLPENTSTEAESTLRCRSLAPGEASGRLLRVNHQEVVEHITELGRRVGFGITYHVNGHRHVARSVGAKSFLDDFRWRDEFGADIATMYFKPEGWGMRDEFADRVGDCVAVSAINDGGGVIYPMPCTRTRLQSWCEFDCVLKESPLADLNPNPTTEPNR